MRQLLVSLLPWRRASGRATPRARDIRVAAGYLALGLLLLGAGMVGIWQGPVGGAVVGRWWFVLPLLAACGLLLVRRRAPVRALLGGLLVVGVDAALGGSTGVLLVQLDLVHWAAMRARADAARWLHRAVLLVVAGGGGAVFVATGDPAVTVNVLVLLFALLVTPVWWWRSVRQQEELGELRAAAAVRDERTRMARDLHDALAGNLSAVAMQAEGLLARQDHDAPGDAGSSPAATRTDATRRSPARADTGERVAARAIRESAVAALDDVRAMVRVLRSDPAAAADELTAPPRLADADALLTTARSRGLHVDAELPAASRRLPAAVDQAAYRLVQEALTNAAKHAPGASVEVRAAVVDDVLHLDVLSSRGTRAGRRPAAGSPGGVGLPTMRERALLLGGTVRAGWEGEPPRWGVHAELPLAPGTRDDLPVTVAGRTDGS